MPIPRLLWPLARGTVRFYWRLSRPVTAGARAMVIDDLGRVLLVRHSYVAGWYLPGGGVERGETVRQALIRELEEEVGVTPLAEPELVGLFANFREFKSDHVALFVVRAFEMTPRRNVEIAEHGFFAPDALPAETTAATARRIREWLDGDPAPECW